MYPTSIYGELGMGGLFWLPVTQTTLWINLVTGSCTCLLLPNSVILQFPTTWLVHEFYVWVLAVNNTLYSKPTQNTYQSAGERKKARKINHSSVDIILMTTTGVAIRQFGIRNCSSENPKFSLSKKQLKRSSATSSLLWLHTWNI